MVPDHVLEEDACELDIPTKDIENASTNRNETILFILPPDYSPVICISINDTLQTVYLQPIIYYFLLGNVIFGWSFPLIAK